MMEVRELMDALGPAATAEQAAALLEHPQTEEAHLLAESTSTSLFPGGVPLGDGSPDHGASARNNREPHAVATHEKHS